ncbi:ABC transporter ATP-binding protein [Boseaceae bacterium BT-24-1]|nr:ABC transporter ATP-binding protein [Boseaceae bacterium BT-24-1]
MAFLELDGLVKHFSSFVAVDGLSLSVERGEFVSLLGPSGCGKTTTLHMIAGFQEPSAGSISVDGVDIVDVPVNKRDIGIVFQNYALFPHMTVADNVGFGLDMRRVPKATRDARVRRALEQVHLETLAGRYPKELSGGQQQRVALARALVIEPKILLLDEPLSNLDAKLREDMQIELKLLQRELGITTILVTHDQNEAMALSDRIAVMHGGRIVQLDAPYQGYERPETPFVAGFLGKANLFDIAASSGAIDWSRIAQSGGPDVSAALGERGALLCVRPEKMAFCGPEEAYLSGVVATRIFLGASWLYQIKVAQFGTVLVAEQNRSASDKVEGSAVHLRWEPGHAALIPGDGQ